MSGTVVVWFLNMPYSIPIQNLYFIFCYAWKRLEESKIVDVGGVNSPELVDLFATVLIGGLKHIIRRTLDRGYIPFTEELSTLRGRIQVHESMNLSVRKAPRLVCKYDELSHDILHNQILKATIMRLIETAGIDRDNAHQLRMMLKSFDAVSARAVTLGPLRSV